MRLLDARKARRPFAAGEAEVLHGPECPSASCLAMPGREGSSGRPERGPECGAPARARQRDCSLIRGIRGCISHASIDVVEFDSDLFYCCRMHSFATISVIFRFYFAQFSFRNSKFEVCFSSEIF